MTDVDLFYNETLTWIFSRLNVKIWRCNVDPIGIVVQSESPPNQTEHLVENPEIVIHNSSFYSLDLSPGTKALITDCYIDAQFKARPTLITANNSHVSIQNCHFGNFINENGSTILYGHYYSHVTIEKSVFKQHNSSKGVLFLQNNCYMFINNSTHSHNVASSSGYSAISLKDGIHAVMINTVFTNNSAVSGGAVIARFQCKIALTNCTFSSNKAITGKTLNISEKSNLQRSVRTPEQNTTGTVKPMSATLFNQTTSDDKKLKVIATHLFIRNSDLKKKSVQQEDALVGTYPGYGGAIYVAAQSQLLVTNCTFEDNSAQSCGGAIITVSNTTLHVQETTFVGNKAHVRYGGAIIALLNATLYIEETTFVGNKANGGGAISAALNATLQIEKTTFVSNKASGEGGAIITVLHSHLRMTNCVFDDNMSSQDGGAICATYNTTLHLQETTFVGNKAQRGAGAILAGLNATLYATYAGKKALSDAGAINIQNAAHLLMTNCVLDDNSGRYGGAIDAASNVTQEIQETNFTRNRAVHQGGAIDVSQQAYLRITNCMFKDNHVEQIGGAIVGHTQAVLEINGTYFSKNNATQAGAIMVQQQVNLSLTNCRLERNCASDG